MKQFTLSAGERLKSRKQIDLLFHQGNHFNVFPLRASFLVSSEPHKGSLQFGAGVPSRYFKKAVDRNRIKRLIRESWRLQKNDLKEALQAKHLQIIIFLVYTGREIPEFNDIKGSTFLVIEKLSRIIHETNSANT